MIVSHANMHEAMSWSKKDFESLCQYHFFLTLSVIKFEKVFGDFKNNLPLPNKSKKTLNTWEKEKQRKSPVSAGGAQT